MSAIVMPACSSRAWIGGDRAEAHDLRADGRDRGGDDPRPRGQAELLGALGAHDEHRPAAPSLSGHELPAVTVPVGPEGRLEVAQDLHRRAGTRAVVAADLRAVLPGHGDDLAIEVAALDRRPPRGSAR
jgi:hypothetical protein